MYSQRLDGADGSSLGAVCELMKALWGYGMLYRAEGGLYRLLRVGGGYLALCWGY